MYNFIITISSASHAPCFSPQIPTHLVCILMAFIRTCPLQSWLSLWRTAVNLEPTVSSITLSTNPITNPSIAALLVRPQLHLQNTFLELTSQPSIQWSQRQERTVWLACNCSSITVAATVSLYMTVAPASTKFSFKWRGEQLKGI